MGTSCVVSKLVEAALPYRRDVLVMLLRFSHRVDARQCSVTPVIRACFPEVPWVGVGVIFHLSGGYGKPRVDSCRAESISVCLVYDGVRRSNLGFVISVIHKT